MRNPLEIVPLESRRHLFVTFLLLTLLFVAIFQFLDQPLRTDAAPNGIVSFELAGNRAHAALIVSSWRPCESRSPDDSLVCDPTPLMFAAFGLGLDYLFMPTYALALALGTLLAVQHRTPSMKYLGALAAYGAFAAALCDAVENFALWQVLLGAYDSGFPAIAAFCASIKFGLILFGILSGLFGWLTPNNESLPV